MELTPITFDRISTMPDCSFSDVIDIDMAQENEYNKELKRIIVGNGSYKDDKGHFLHLVEISTCSADGEYFRSIKLTGLQAQTLISLLHTALSQVASSEVHFGINGNDTWREL